MSSQFHLDTLRNICLSGVDELPEPGCLPLEGVVGLRRNKGVIVLVGDSWILAQQELFRLFRKMGMDYFGKWHTVHGGHGCLVEIREPCSTRPDGDVQLPFHQLLELSCRVLMKAEKALLEFKELKFLFRVLLEFPFPLCPLQDTLLCHLGGEREVDHEIRDNGVLVYLGEPGEVHPADALVDERGVDITLRDDAASPFEVRDDELADKVKAVSSEKKCHGLRLKDILLQILPEQFPELGLCGL